MLVLSQVVPVISQAQLWLQHTDTGSPSVQVSMIAALDGVPLLFDDVVVGSQYDSDCCETANFQIDCCDSTNGSAADNEDCLFVVSHRVR